MTSELHARELEYLRSANRSCGMSYRSACRRNSGIELAKELKARGLLVLHDKGDRCQQGRYVWKTTELGKKALANHGGVSGANHKGSSTNGQQPDSETDRARDQ